MCIRDRLNLAKAKLEAKLAVKTDRASRLDRLDKYYSTGAIVISNLQTQKNEMVSKIRVIEEVVTRITGVNRSIAVSYTHLDVYKRQALYIH